MRLSNGESGGGSNGVKGAARGRRRRKGCGSARLWTQKRYPALGGHAAIQVEAGRNVVSGESDAGMVDT
jgi:hypothetical protein